MDRNEDAGFNLGILAYVLLTGQPSMSFVREGAINPFRETAGAYKGIPTNLALKSTQFREILIDFRADRKHLEQQERIVLFNDDLLKTWTFPSRPDGRVRPAMLKSG